MEECVFCSIVANKVPSKLKKETDNFIVFEDINPKADIHLLIIPKKHFVDISEIEDALWLEVRAIALQLRDEHNLSGFRLVNNFGTAQAVKHLHIHFLGGVDVDRNI